MVAVRTEVDPARMRFTVETLTLAALARSAIVGRFIPILRTVSSCQGYIDTICAEAQFLSVNLARLLIQINSRTGPNVREREGGHRDRGGGRRKEPIGRGAGVGLQ